MTGAGLTGGPITTTGTISLTTTGISAGTYGSSTAIPRITVDVYGRVTGVTTQSLAAATSISNGGSSVVAGTSNVTIDATGQLNILTSMVVSGTTILNGTPLIIAATGVSVPDSFRIGTNGDQTLHIGAATALGSVVLYSSGVLLRGVCNDASGFFLGRGNFGGGTANSLSFAGDTNTGSAAFSVGTVFKSGGGSFSASSDERLKDIIGGYELGLDALLSLEPIRFKYKQKGNKIHVGISAQAALQTPFKTMVFKDEMGFYAVDNSELIYAVVNALREVDKRLQFLGG